MADKKQAKKKARKKKATRTVKKPAKRGSIPAKRIKDAVKKVAKKKAAKKVTEPESKPLNAKQARFVDEYLLDLNATQAAIRAGYSKKTAGSQAHDLLKKPEIQKALQTAMKGRSERTKIDADWLLKRLADEAEADIADLYTDEYRLKPVSEWPEIWRKGLVAGLDVEQLFEGSGKDRKFIGHLVKIKVSDRVRRLELIGKHVDVQAFPTKIEHTGPGGGPQEHVLMDKDDYAKIRAQMLKKDGC